MKRNRCKRYLTVIAVMILFLTSVSGQFMYADAVTEYSDTSGYPSLKELYSDRFKVGVSVQAIDHWNDPTAEIGNPDKEKLIEGMFNSITFGNEFKPAYNFDPGSDTLFKVDPAAEELLDYAKDHGIPVRGHVLVWHSQVDPAIFARDFKATSGGKRTDDYDAVLDKDCLVGRDELINRLRTYIYGVIEYTYANGYGDVIYAWDVVNEATDEGEADGLRNSYWKQIIGPEYLYYSFLFAREACVKYSGEYGGDIPELFYNDYNEWYPSRIETICRFLKEDKFNDSGSLIKSDVIDENGDGTIVGDGLIDGIGMQGHLDCTQNIDNYVEALRAYDEVVPNIHITELDVGITGSGPAAYYKQAEFYYDFFKALIEEKDNGVGLNCVTFWGLTDDASWRQGADPLLFNADLSRKSCFDAVVMAGRGEEFSVDKEEALKQTGDLVIDFEPVDDKLAIVKVLGFKSRGTGHQANLMLVNIDNHTEGADPGYCLKVSRKEQDASVKLDISRFIGEDIRVEAYVKTSGNAVYQGISGDDFDNRSDPVKLEDTDASGSGWIHTEEVFYVPGEWNSAEIYWETDDSEDIYIDDVSVKILADDDPDKGNDPRKWAEEIIDDLSGGNVVSSPDEASEELNSVWDKITNFFRNIFG